MHTLISQCLPIRNPAWCWLRCLGQLPVMSSKWTFGLPFNILFLKALWSDKSFWGQLGPPQTRCWRSWTPLSYPSIDENLGRVNIQLLLLINCHSSIHGPCVSTWSTMTIHFHQHNFLKRSNGSLCKNRKKDLLCLYFQFL